jgi:hypothetical protein
MPKVDERLDALLDYRMRRAAGDPCDEGDAASVMFDGRFRQTSIRGLSTQRFADTCVA